MDCIRPNKLGSETEPLLQQDPSLSYQGIAETETRNEVTAIVLFCHITLL